MNLIFQQGNRTRLAAFSLIEVILATGILALSILAVIAFLGATGQTTSDVIDNAVASRIADNVRAELENEDLDNLFNLADPTDPVVLFGTKDGERVLLNVPGGIVHNPETADPPGIATYNRYFLIEIRRLENSLEFDSSTFVESAMLPVSVQVVWPNEVRTGPTSSQPGVPEQQSRYVFNAVILRKQ